MKNFLKHMLRLLRLLPLPLLGMAFLPLPLSAQPQDPVTAMACLAGVTGEEELTEGEVERYEVFLSRPLELNLSSRGRLLSSGLLSPYQVASLQDYRSRNGDVLSITELSLVDGFGKDFVKALAPFVSLRAKHLPGALPDDTLRVRHDLLLQARLRAVQSGVPPAWNWGLKYRLNLGERFETSLAARSVYGGAPWPPSAYSMHMVLYGRRGRGKVILGDFSTRFGQGIALWSGMAMSGFSSSYSFVHRPSGLGPSWSWSGPGMHRGVAADFTFGRFLLSSFLSFPGLRERMQGGRSKDLFLLPGVNLAWFGRNGQVSVTGFVRSPSSGGVPLPAGKISADFRYSRKGADIFGECAYDCFGHAFAAVAGTSFLVRREFRLLGVLRGYPAAFTAQHAAGSGAWAKTSDEYGLAVGLERGAAVLTADYARKASDAAKRQWKFLARCPLQLFPTLVLTLRTSERIKPGELLRYRTDLRADLDWFSRGLDARYGAASASGWSVRLRGECLVCRSAGLLTYLEGGRKGNGWSAYVRSTFFRVDHWDDRIYSYERNAPGNFTVPAYYGRGCCVSVVAGGKIRLARNWKMLKLYARFSTVRYPFMQEKKPGRTELSFQMVADL